MSEYGGVVVAQVDVGYDGEGSVYVVKPVPGRYTGLRNKTMAVISKAEYTEPRVIDLGGPDGNAFALLGIAHGALKQLGYDSDMYIKIMKADDDGNLVRTFNNLLGDYFTIVLPEDVDSIDDL